MESTDRPWEAMYRAVVRRLVEAVADEDWDGVRAVAKAHDGLVPRQRRQKETLAFPPISTPEGAHGAPQGG